MENTPQNKSRFFALYLWQQVWVKESVYELDPFPVNPEMLYEPSGEEYLLLTPIPSITKEDAIVIAKIMYPSCDMQNAEDMGVRIAKRVFGGNGYDHSEASINTYQYLTSKGYALEYHGLTIAKLIEYGWIKLK